MKQEENTDEIEISDSDELYEKLVITIDKGQEPLRIDKFLMNKQNNNLFPFAKKI